MNSDEFLAQIKTYSDQYAKWIEPINQLRKSLVSKRGFNKDDLKDMEIALAEMHAKQTAENDLPNKIYSFLDEHYLSYLGFSQEQCERIIASFYGNRDFEDLLFTYTNRAIEKLKNTGEEAWLWKGLVSSSLENCGIDYRDFLGALSELFRASMKHGINPINHFRRVAAISSRVKPRAYKISVSEMMMDFINRVEER
jgi:hypothetical protein